jgi:hypothetical protein
MANSIQVIAAIQNATLSETSPLTLTQKVDMDVEVAAAATAQAAALGGLTNVKSLIVIGGEGITFKLANETTATAISAYPFAVITNLDGFAQSSLWFSNSSGLAKMVRILAGG